MKQWMLDGSLMILIYSLALILCNLEERKIAKFIYTVTLFSAVQGLSYQSSFGKKKLLLSLEFVWQYQIVEGYSTLYHNSLLQN